MHSDAATTDAAVVEQIRDLYERGGLSTRRIAEALGVGRRLVDRSLREAGVAVAPRGAGRSRPRMRHRDPDELAEQLYDLYVRARLTRQQVAEKLGLTEGLVRTRLAEYGITSRTRGQHNREDRSEPDEKSITTLYCENGLSARATGDLLGVSHRIVLRTAHDHGLPVRPGAPTMHETGPIELIKTLYADALVDAVLTRRGVPRIPPGGPIWLRFPDPVPLSEALCAELYVDCGVSLTHIELLTGQPATAIRRLLVHAGIQLRSPGGRCPFLRRHKEAGCHRTALSPRGVDRPR